MFKAKPIFIVLLAIFMLSLTGCGLWPFSTDALSPSGTDATAIMEATDVQSTVAVLQTALAQLTATRSFSMTSTPNGSGGATSTTTSDLNATLTPTQTSTAVPIILPSRTSVPPTSTPTITPTVTRTATHVLPTPTLTPTPLPCNWVEVEADISIPDGTDFKAGIPFIKAWRLKNAGTCTWNEQYDLIFSSGNAMFGPAIADIRQIVKPGETVDISMSLISPSREGNYIGYWKIRSHDGVVFGIGNNHNSGIDVNIDVTNNTSPASDARYDFAAKYRKATWKTSRGDIAPDGPADYRNGGITISSAPLMEINHQDDELALIVIPNQGTTGNISGRYPAIDIQAGDHFTSLLSCGDNKANCDVTFQIEISVDGGSKQSLGTWPQVYDGSYDRVDIDLGAYAGHSVQFTLIVLNNGSSQNDEAVWLAPKIVQEP